MKFLPHLMRSILTLIIFGAIFTYVSDLSVENIEQMLQVPILGVVPYDHDVRKSLHLNHPVVLLPIRCSQNRDRVAVYLIAKSCIGSQTGRIERFQISR